MPLQILADEAKPYVRYSSEMDVWSHSTDDPKTNVDIPMVKRIDYIFTKNFKVHSYIHINKRLDNNRHISDHLPVMVIFQ